METPESLPTPSGAERNAGNATSDALRSKTSRQAYVLLCPENGYELPEGFGPDMDNRALMFGADTRYG